MTTNITFRHATKEQLKGRIALDGPTGAGKTWTALEVATVLGERIVMIDTERGSGALYSDHFTYDYFRFDPPYDPARLVEVIKAAEAEHYDVIMMDSLSHFWEGEGGTLDIVDAAGQRSGGNQFAGWKVGSPALRHMIDTILGVDAHVIVTMRSKMEYVLETNEKGRQVPRKVGMAPVMRAGVEFEFTLVGDMDLEHRMVISKSRCSVLADEVVAPHRAADMAATFKAWLESGDPLVNRAQVAEIVGVLNSIQDPETRKEAKAEFRDSVGHPDRLKAKDYDEALEFARSLAQRNSGRGGGGVSHPTQGVEDPGAASPLDLVAPTPPEVVPEHPEFDVDAPQDDPGPPEPPPPVEPTPEPAEATTAPLTAGEIPTDVFDAAIKAAKAMTDDDLADALVGRGLSTAGNKNARQFRLATDLAKERVAGGGWNDSDPF